MVTANSLSAAVWARAALARISSGGVDAVKVETLASELGVTKGSFYWHFADRSALVAAALELWEWEGTTEVVAALDDVDDPRARLRALFETSFGDLVDSPIESALVTRIDDPVVGPVVERVSIARIAFLERLFRELGLTPSRAAVQARIVYSLYVGHGQVRRTLPDDPVIGDPRPAYLRRLLDVATP